MNAYVEEAGGVSLCSDGDRSGCDERSLKFLDKWKEKPLEEATSQLERLNSMKDGKMKPDLKKWLTTRIGMLKSLHDEL
jgi:hypothetical protein